MPFPHVTLHAWFLDPRIHTYTSTSLQNTGLILCSILSLNFSSWHIFYYVFSFSVYDALFILVGPCFFPPFNKKRSLRCFSVIENEIERLMVLDSDILFQLFNFTEGAVLFFLHCCLASFDDKKSTSNLDI